MTTIYSMIWFHITTLCYVWQVCREAEIHNADHSNVNTTQVYVYMCNSRTWHNMMRYEHNDVVIEWRCVLIALELTMCKWRYRVTLTNKCMVGIVSCSSNNKQEFLSRISMLVETSTTSPGCCSGIIDL